MSRTGQVRQSSTFWRGAATLIALVGVMTSPARAGAVIQFDPDGPGSVGTGSVVTFDEKVGNALIQNVINPATGALNVGTVLPVLYQATIPSLVAADGTTIVFTYGGSGNVPGQLTITASFNETITSVSGTTVTFSGVGAQPVGGINIYYNTTAVASDLLGTNFAPGTLGNSAAFTPTLIYTGTVNGGSIAGNFTNTNNTGVPALDQFNVNNYPSITSVEGTGSTTLTATTTFANPDFFKTNLIGSNLGFFFNTSNVLAFHQTDPAGKMFDNTGAAGTPTGVVLPAGYDTPVSTIGTQNGRAGAGGGISGPNLILQSDANSSFEPVGVVPEPSTISAALTGIVLASLAGLRAQRHRNKTSAV